MGAFDNRIYIYDCTAGYTLSSMISQHNSFITHFDFSASSQYLMSNCGAYELCFFEADTGMHIPGASRLKDVRWATQTSPLSWATSSIWPPQADGTEITAVDCNVANANGQIVVASGDNFGRLSLHRYPAVGTKGLPKAQRYRGHSAHITKVRFASGDSHLLSIAAHDRAIFQWAHEGDDLAHADEADAKPFATAGDLGDADAARSSADPGGGGAIDGEVAGGKAAAASAKEKQEGDYVAAKPWLLSIVEPSDPPKPDASAPEHLSLELEAIHGFAGAGATRSAIAYNMLGEVIFPCGSNCVVYSKQTHSQTFYREHASTVAALATSDDGHFIASGENTHRPRVHVWDAQTCTNVITLPAFHRQGIVSLSFARDARRCVSVGADADFSLAVWRSVDGEWYDGFLEANSVGGDKPVNFAHFTDKHDEEHQLVTGGVDHVTFWTLNGATLTPLRALWGSVGKLQTMLCGAAIGIRFVTGASSGHLYVWKNRRCEKMIRAHERSIESLHATPAGLVTAGSDGFVKLWTLQFQHLRSYDLAEAPVPPLLAAVCGVHSALDMSGGAITKIIVGTASSEVYEIAKDSGSITLLAEGHHGDGAEVWGLAPHPTDADVFATSGDDATVRIWSVGQRRLLRKAKLDTPTRAVAWSPDGKRLLVGMGGHASGLRQKKDGAFLILNAETMQVLFEGRDSRHYIRDAKFSPDGKSFALGSMDQKIYLYDAASTVLRAKCDKHTSYVMSLDFSDDSAYVQSDAGDYEHLYHNAMDGTNFRLPSQLKNVEWSSWTCVFGWPVQGAWPTYNADAASAGGATSGGGGGAKALPDVTTTDRSRGASRPLLAVGDEAGVVRVFKYPCLAKSAGALEQAAHVSHISRARFNASGTHLITVGKRDRGVMVWRVVDSTPAEKKPSAADKAAKGSGGASAAGGGDAAAAAPPAP